MRLLIDPCCVLRMLPVLLCCVILPLLAACCVLRVFQVASVAGLFTCCMRAVRLARCVRQLLSASVAACLVGFVAAIVSPAVAVAGFSVLSRAAFTCCFHRFACCCCCCHRFACFHVFLVADRCWPMFVNHLRCCFVYDRTSTHAEYSVLATFRSGILCQRRDRS